MVADAVAAIVIALDVLHDGFKHTGAAIRDLSDEMPRTNNDKEFDPLIKEVQGHRQVAGHINSRYAGT